MIRAINLTMRNLTIAACAVALFVTLAVRAEPPTLDIAPGAARPTVLDGAGDMLTTTTTEEQP